MSHSKPCSSICVLGLGYIGLPTAAILATHGIDVIGVDVNPEVVAAIKLGQIHIVEPGLQAMVQQAVAHGGLRATATPQVADVYLIAVPTPLNATQQPDLSHVWAAASAIAPLLKRDDLVILESTSPVGTTEQLAQWLAAERGDLRLPLIGAVDVDIHLAYCPERVLPGQVLRELLQTDRIIGGLTAACSQRAAGVYRLFAAGQLLLTDARTAEMAKLSENAFRDVNIAFANELSIICDKLGVDVAELIKLANHHPRVNILQPGCGVGGHCIAVDPWFIVDQAPDQARLIRTARAVNDAKPQWVIDKLEQAILASKLDAAELTIGCLGLAYKADSDDLRQSPALKIALALAEKYPGRVLVSEPNIKQLPQTLLELGVQLVSIEQALNCPVVLKLVDHGQFKAHRQTVTDAQVVVSTLWE